MNEAEIAAKEEQLLERIMEEFGGILEDLARGQKHSGRILKVAALLQELKRVRQRRTRV